MVRVDELAVGSVFDDHNGIRQTVVGYATGKGFTRYMFTTYRDEEYPDTQWPCQWRISEEGPWTDECTDGRAQGMTVLDLIARWFEPERREWER